VTLRASIPAVILAAWTPSLAAAVFGSATVLMGSGSDLVLDESRARLYVVNSVQNRVEIYSTSQQRLLTPVTVGSNPISAALSRDSKTLYVSCYDDSTLQAIDLDALSVRKAVSLPAGPEGVAVAGDGRVLITTAGDSNGANTLMIFNPVTGILNAVPVTPPAPTPPQLPAPSSQVYASSRSRLQATRDGAYVIGINNPTSSSRTVFVYETASATVLLSRTVTNISTVLAVSRDGSRFMAGLTLFDRATLNVSAQENAANSLYPFPQNVNFNTRSNQGGSVFAPDGSVVYAAFNIAPVDTPESRPNVSQFMINDPDNLLIRSTLMLPENLQGKMVITSDGGTVYGLSDSGFLTIPVSTLPQYPIAALSDTVVVLTNDQCGVTAKTNSYTVTVSNAGGGRLSATAQLQQTGPTANLPLSGVGGPGGGAPGVPITISSGEGPPIQLPGGIPTPGQQNSMAQIAAALQIQQTGNGATFTFTYNPKAAASLGTIAPNDFIVTSPEAVNIPSLIRVFQNNRNSEAPGDLIPVPTGSSVAEGLYDVVFDSPRNRLYIANSGLNRLEVFDTRQKTFLAPVKVGQLPHSLALSPDGNFLYVANTGSESISIVDLNQLQLTGQAGTPPIPFNASFAISTPHVIAATQRGLLAIFTDNTAGTLWELAGNLMLPRAANAVIGVNAQGQPNTIPAPFTIASSAGGESAIILDGSGVAYLYDSTAGDFTKKEALVSGTIQGYYGPIAAGPRGQYFVVNDMLLNAGLAQVSASQGTPLASAVAPIGPSSYATFTQPSRTGASSAVMQAPLIQTADSSSGNPSAIPVPALEGPVSTQTGNQRVNLPGRLMTVDPATSTAYLLTASGLSIIPLQANSSPSPQMNPQGTVSLSNYAAAFAPGELLSIFGQNLSSSTQSAAAPLPAILGNTCVTVNNQPVPLAVVSADQINAQIPPTLAPGTYTAIVRSIDRHSTSQPSPVAIAKYAPSVFVDPSSGQAAIYYTDGSPVTPQHAAARDQRLVLYAAGLGSTNSAVPAGQPSPANATTTQPVSVYFGNPGYSQSAIVLEWSGLAPGLIGVYQINLYVPGTHMKGDRLPVTIRVGGVSSPQTGNLMPYVALQ
jgi:uncharacterized protein (TIGR03437 family)